MNKIKFLFLLSVLSLMTSSSAFAKEEDNVVLLSSTTIFKPLIADTKWPRFTLAYQYFGSGPYGRQVFSPNFGAVLPMIRNTGKADVVYELSMHAGLFAIMDIGSTPTRLIDADYFVGPALAIIQGPFEYMARIAHTSSHLGDEFMLSSQGKNIKRINLSYETAEVLAAYNFGNGLRPYVGAGYIVHAEPKDYKSAEVTIGMDYRSPKTILEGFAKPVAGIHSKTSNNYHWNPSLSIKAGLEFEDRIFIGKALQVLIEYYNGNSVYGQFYKQHTSYIGASLNLNF